MTMYGKRLQMRSLYGTVPVTELREWDGRRVHVVGWSKTQIDGFKEEQEAIRRRHEEEKQCDAGGVEEPKRVRATDNLGIVLLLSLFSLMFLMASILLTFVILSLLEWAK